MWKAESPGANQTCENKPDASCEVKLGFQICCNARLCQEWWLPFLPNTCKPKIATLDQQPSLKTHKSLRGTKGGHFRRT